MHMRGLLNYNIAAFASDNPLSFPPISAVADPVNADEITWTGFDNAVTRDSGNGLHFYESDYKLNRMWENPKKYIGVLSRYKCVIQPDFSLYYDFPVALQIYNKFRNHWLSAFYAVNGIEMIPNISLSTPENYMWSLLGYPTQSVVAFSDIGTAKDKSEREIIHRAYETMIRELDPIQILYFTRSKRTAPSEATVITLPYKKGE